MTAQAAYARMKQLGITNVATFNEIGITSSPIRIDDLMELLNFEGMLRRKDVQDGIEKWTGSLVEMRQAIETLAGTTGHPMQAVAVQLLEAYRMWFSHVTNPRQVNWDTRIPDYARPFMVFRSLYANQPNMPTSAQFDLVASKGGGLLQITQQEYDQLKAADDAVVAAEADAALQSVVRQRITNASALAGERIRHSDAPEVQAQKWAQAWLDGV